MSFGTGTPDESQLRAEMLRRLVGEKQRQVIAAWENTVKLVRERYDAANNDPNRLPVVVEAYARLLADAEEQAESYRQQVRPRALCEDPRRGLNHLLPASH